MEKAEVAHRLQELSLFLRDSYSDLRDAIRAEKETKAAAWKSGLTKSLHGKPMGSTDLGRYIESEAVDDVCNRVDIEQQIHAYEEERDHLRFLLKYGLVEFIDAG